MKKADEIQFLQWALPQMGLRWEGFRKVRKQVIRRIDQRLQKLQIDLVQYPDYLQAHEEEWGILDSLCRITISRFYRDREIFDILGEQFLPEMTHKAVRDGRPLRLTSLGSASGEEPYTLSLLIHFTLLKEHPDLNFFIDSWEIDPELIKRALKGCYRSSSLKELPEEWIKKAFMQKKDEFCLLDIYRKPVSFFTGDIRQNPLTTVYDLVLCRNLAATYFSVTRQHVYFSDLRKHIRRYGMLVIGSHETIPDGINGFLLIGKGIYRGV